MDSSFIRPITPPPTGLEFLAAQSQPLSGPTQPSRHERAKQHSGQFPSRRLVVWETLPARTSRARARVWDLVLFRQFYAEVSRTTWISFFVHALEHRNLKQTKHWVHLGPHVSVEVR